MPLAGWLVAFMWFAYFLNYSDRQAIFAMFPSLKADLNFSDSQLGLIGAVFLWVYGFGCPIAGYIADRFSKRWLVIGSLAIWSLVTTATGLVNSVLMMLLLRAAMGVSESMYMPAAVSLTAGAHAPDQRSRAVSILTTAQIVGTLVGGSFGGVMAGLGHWRLAFFILGGIGLVYVLPYWLFLRSFDEAVESGISEAEPGSAVSAAESENPYHSNPMPSSLGAAPVAADSRPLYNTMTYVLLCFAFPVFVFGLWLLYSWLPNFMYEKFSLTIAQAALVSTITLQTSMFIGLIAGGTIADLLFKLNSAARLWLLVFSLLICSPSLYFIGNSDSLIITSVAAGVFGLIGGFFAGNIFPAAFEVVAASRRASAVGWLNFFGSMISGFAPLFGGQWKTAIGIDGLLAGTAVAYFVAAICLSLGIARWYRQDYERVH